MEFEGRNGSLAPKCERKWKGARAERTACWKEEKCESRQRRRKHHWDGSPAQAEEVDQELGHQPQETPMLSVTGFHNKLEGSGSSKAAHPSDLVNIWLK